LHSSTDSARGFAHTQTLRLCVARADVRSTRLLRRLRRKALVEAVGVPKSVFRLGLCDHSLVKRVRAALSRATALVDHLIAGKLVCVGRRCSPGTRVVQPVRCRSPIEGLQSLQVDLVLLMVGNRSVGNRSDNLQTGLILLILLKLLSFYADVVVGIRVVATSNGLVSLLFLHDMNGIRSSTPVPRLRSVPGWNWMGPGWSCGWTASRLESRGAWWRRYGPYRA
jgi:hypothetical protein